MVLAAMLVFVIERRFVTAALWALAASLLSFFGLIHAYTLDPRAGVLNHFGWAAAPGFAAAYLGGALLLVLMHLLGVDAPEAEGDEILADGTLQLEAPARRGPGRRRRT